ncbi:MAG: DegQ family serine endoprotease [Gammaproteobacteria bacterium]|nr:DegQ family serine endoprotease [Gammaproteobacteria bacterium]
MLRKRRWRVFFDAVVLCGVLYSGLLNAALPVAVDGEPLPSLAPMLDEVRPSVVNISTVGRTRIPDNPLYSDPFFRRFFGEPRSRPSQSLGSGVIVDAEEGFVITNHHVIANADAILVTLSDSRSFEAELVGTDPDSEVAVIKIPAEDLTAIDVGDSEALRVGDFVVAIGSPFGLSQTVTSGIVSALGRSGLFEGYEDFIQTDASINPGNSGGALVNLRGELVGVNTAIVAPGGGSVGIGFAIPVNMIRNLMTQIIEYGEVRRGHLGVRVQDLTPELAQAFNIDAQKGAVISQVLPESAAEEAGLQEGDVVIGVDGLSVDSASDLRNTVGLLRAGERVKLDILRDGKRLSIKSNIKAPESIQRSGEGVSSRLEGAALSDLAPDAERPEGAVVVVEVEPGSPAWQAGLRKDDIIVSVNRLRVTNVEEMREAVRRNQKALLLNIQRAGGALFLVIR